MIAALRRLFLRARALQPDAVRLADLLEEREQLRQQRDRALDLAEQADGVARAALSKAQAAEARRAAEFDAAERYLAERDGLQGRVDQLVASGRYWMAETDRLNRLLAAQGAAARGGSALPAGVIVLAEYRQARPDAVDLPFLGPIA